MQPICFLVVQNWGTNSPSTMPSSSVMIQDWILFTCSVGRIVTEYPECPFTTENSQRCSNVPLTIIWPFWNLFIRFHSIWFQRQISFLSSFLVKLLDASNCFFVRVSFARHHGSFFLSCFVCKSITKIGLRTCGTITMTYKLYTNLYL